MSRPLSVVLDTTDRCNLKCKMCYFSSVDRLNFQPYDVPVPTRGMELDLYRRIAETWFPRAWRIALACAAEPLLHPKFDEIVKIAGTYAPEELWFPTNLLALTEKKAEAIVEAGVTSVGLSIDGFTPETYEHIRVGGSWDRLMQRIELFNRVREGSATQLRLIFTWMRSNREHLKLLPEFASRVGASELDVRFVAPTVGVDNGPELLSGEDQSELNDELAEVAHDAVARGMHLAYYPSFTVPADGSRNPLKRLARVRWKVRAGLYRKEYFRYRWYQRQDGCFFPGRVVVIRANGAVAPCYFWEDAPFGVFPEEELDTLERKALDLQEELRCGRASGCCVECPVRRDHDALYQPRLDPAEAAEI